MNLGRRRQRNRMVRAGRRQACSMHPGICSWHAHGAPPLPKRGLDVRSLRTAARHVDSRAAAAIAVQPRRASGMQASMRVPQLACNQARYA